jgi:hypothetical protein
VRTPCPTPLLLLALPLLGCVINSERYPRPRDLPEQAIVDKLRLLAIRADPPEVAPGGAAALTALLVDPADEIGFTVWTACSPEEVTDFGCPLDPSVFGDELPSPEQLEEAGVIGVEPGFPPTFVAPVDALDDVPATERAEGVNWTVGALALPDETEPTEEFDFNRVESGFKRVVVSDSPAPNRNPRITGFTVDGVPVDPGQVVVLDPGEPYYLGLELADDAVETYPYTTPDGVEEQRVEEPFAEWYASDGEVDEFFTLHPFLDSTWVSPGAPGVEGRWWAVLKDRRGGITWVSRRWRTR